MKGIVLLSGGLDSTLVLLKMLREGHKCIPIFMDYNQWSLEGEEDAADSVTTWAGMYTGKNDLGDLGSVITIQTRWGPMMFANLGEEKVGSVWGRGIALVGLAAMWAYTHGDDFEFIALGNHKGDVGPDCKPGAFDASLHDALIEGTKGQLDLVLPIRELTVEDIGKELAEFGIPWELMYSCYWYPPCGYKSASDKYLCPGCRRKAIAMVAAESTDKTLLTRPNSPQRTYQSDKATPTGY